MRVKHTVLLKVTAAAAAVLATVNCSPKILHFKMEMPAKAASERVKSYQKALEHIYYNQEYDGLEFEQLDFQSLTGNQFSILYTQT